MKLRLNIRVMIDLHNGFNIHEAQYVCLNMNQRVELTGTC